MGDEELIPEENWYDEELDSDAEVREAKRKKLEDAKNDSSEISRTFKLPSSNIEQPLTRHSPRLQLARRTLAAQRNKKQLKGIYEAIPEGAALVKNRLNPHHQSARATRHSLEQVGRSEIRESGPRRKIPLINFAARKSVCNPHKKLIENIQQHAKEQK